MQLIEIGQVMTREVECVEPTALFSEVVDLLVESDISCIVVARDRIPLGMISETNILRAVYRHLHDSPLPVYAAEVMSAPVITVFESATVHETLCLIEERSIRRVVVVDDRRHLVGILTQTDLLRAQSWDLEIARQAARRQSKAPAEGSVANGERKP